MRRHLSLAARRLFGRPGPARLPLVLALGTLLAAAAACGGGEKAEKPASLQVKEVLERSAQAMGAISSFRLTLENEGGETPIPGGLAMRSARGVMVKPDKVDLQLKALVAGLLVEVRVISIGQKTYVSNPITGQWQQYESGLSPLAFFDPAKGVVQILRDVREPALAEDADAGGKPAYRVRGKLPASVMQFITGSYAEGSVLETELAIGKEDLLLRRVRLEGRITREEALGIRRVLEFSEFGQQFPIQAPQ